MLFKVSIIEEKRVTPFVQNSKPEKPFLIYEYLQLECNYKKIDEKYKFEEGGDFCAKWMGKLIRNSQWTPKALVMLYF